MKNWWSIILLSFMFFGCESTPPTIGTLVVNSDLPYTATGTLKIGLTLNPTSEGRDVLTKNMIVNGSFDLAPTLTNGKYDHTAKTVTTPNGYTTFYPLPDYVYPWVLCGGKGFIRVDTKSNKTNNHYYTITIAQKDSISFATLENKTYFKVKKGQSFRFKAHLQSDNCSLRACLVSLSPNRVISNLTNITPHGDWNDYQTTLTALEDQDSVCLRIQTIPSMISMGNSSHIEPSIDIDDVWLEPEKRISLDKLLKPLSPYFLRFPDGATANGFYPGTYPLHFQGSHPDSVPIWTIHGAEYTGSFSARDFINLSRAICAQPILVENIGFTDPSAAQRIEDIALVTKRAEYFKHIFQVAQYDSLLLQLGYNMPAVEYQKRFTAIEKSFIEDTLRTNFISGTWLTNDKQPYSDYICDFALPVLLSPDFSSLLPPDALQLFSQSQPFMLGEVHFASSLTLDHYIPPLTLRTAFLIQAENYAHLIRGIALYPLISPNMEDMPILLLEGGDYRPTPLYDYLYHYGEYSGEILRRIEKDSNDDNGLYTSLTSNSDNSIFFLKLTNTTRHPLPYTIQMKGKDFRPTKYKALRFRPESPTTVGDPRLMNQFLTVEEKGKVKKKRLFLSIQPFESVLLKMYSGE